MVMTGDTGLLIVEGLSQRLKEKCNWQFFFEADARINPKNIAFKISHDVVVFFCRIHRQICDCPNQKMMFFPR